MRWTGLICILAVLLTACASTDNTSTNTNTSTTTNTSTGNVAATSNANANRANNIPSFPWPPDQASAFTSIPAKALVKQNEQAKLGEVDERLRDALTHAGYEQTGYYQVPGGFVVVTQLEQFNPDTGLPLTGSQRWATRRTPPGIFTVQYWRELITGGSGHYRVIALTVSNAPIIGTVKDVNVRQAAELMPGGASYLPNEIQDMPYTREHRCAALIYEFLQGNSGGAQFVPSSELQPGQHLRKIITYLENPR